MEYDTGWLQQLRKGNSVALWRSETKASKTPELLYKAQVMRSTPARVTVWGRTGARYVFNRSNGCGTGNCKKYFILPIGAEGAEEMAPKSTTATRLRQGSRGDADTPRPHRIFVYGTLRTGGRLNIFLDGQKKVADAVTQKEYRLYSNGSYPYLVPARDKGKEIVGEIWDVTEDCMQELRMLESEYNVGGALLQNRPAGEIVKVFVMEQGAPNWRSVAAAISAGRMTEMVDFIKEHKGR